MFQILIVEDDKELSQLFQKVLEKNGYQVKSASDGAQALEVLDKEYIDLIISDIMMPVMDGIAATQQIREIEQKEHKKRLPIIAVTARAMFGDKERILENKLDDYIAKPYNLNTVVETLNRYIDKKED